MTSIKRALVSVSDKTNIQYLANFFINENIEVISTGGTRQKLEELGVKVIPIEKITGNPESFGGRMKTISFQIGSALLFKRDNSNDIKEAKDLGVDPIDLVVCNLYPFEEIAKAQSKSMSFNQKELIENIDIGGPTMIRAAAKNFDAITILTDPIDYKGFVDQYPNVTKAYRFNLAKKAFALTARYDQFIARTFEDREKNCHMLEDYDFSCAKELRYGENAHQKAKLYIDPKYHGKSVAGARFLQGKPLSYNNILDADAAWRCASDLKLLIDEKEWFHDYHGAVVVKHQNPCGVALSRSLQAAQEFAWNGDNISAFGSVICLTSEVNDEIAHFFNDKFIEVLMAPSFSESALTILKKKKNLRILECQLKSFKSEEVIRSVSGGLLVQEEDEGLDLEMQNVTEKKMKKKHLKAIDFGVVATKHLKSNAISLIAKSGDHDYYLAGAGMGQPNRIDSLTRLAVPRAKEKGLIMSDLILISDAFFPFPDTIEAAYAQGITKIVQPGGSIKDQEVIDACDDHGISMMMTRRRHFRH